MRGYILKNIILIGMPGAGKSTTGVILAKMLGMRFIDTDIVIQENAKKLLQEIIDKEGPETFLQTEENAVLSIRSRNTVIATGGSVVFSRRAMDQLKSEGIVLYLKISFEEMVHRISNITTRGIVLNTGEDLHDMYCLRVPLYEQYADITIDCEGSNFETLVGTIIDELKKFPDMSLAA